MRLVIVHNHFRPGGVRRVIELGAPCLMRALRPKVDQVVLASGEAIAPAWLDSFISIVRPARVVPRVEPALAYLAEQRRKVADVRRRIASFLRDLLGGPDRGNCLCWAHNQGLGRNLVLTRELERACAERDIRLLFHHHDWWFDNRWERWREMRRSGFATLPKVAETIFCTAPFVKHATINQTDTAVLKKHLDGVAGWIPNPAGPRHTVSRRAQQRARTWLDQQLPGATVWLMPCRLLRRKNIAEALLLARWLRPEAWLVTTGGVSSADEQNYARRLAAAARKHGWKLRLSILDRTAAAPSVPELIAASEAVLLTSLQEGFGLTYLEVALRRKPLICRALANIMPDLTRFGFRFRHSYAEIWIDPALFEWSAESKRQGRLFAAWRRNLPAQCRHLAQRPVLLSNAKRAAVPFNRLTLTAQLEVLSVPVEQSWALCCRHNPGLASWRQLASESRLFRATCPARAARHLGEAACAGNFRRLLAQKAQPSESPLAAVAAQEEFIRQRLATENLYPLTWNSIT